MNTLVTNASFGKQKVQNTQSRSILLRSLIDIISLPETQISNSERQLTGELVEHLLSEASIHERRKIAERLSHLKEVPYQIIILLSCDQIEVAKELLENGKGFSYSDLISISNKMGHEYRLAISHRKYLPTPLTDALIAKGDYQIIRTVLQNDGSKISQHSMEKLVQRSSEFAQIIPDLCKRPELRIGHALQLFWHAQSKTRQDILQRFAIERRFLQESCSYIFSIYAQEEKKDKEVNTILQVIERRQINRQALSRSSFPNLESVVTTAARMQNRELADEIAYFSNIAPITLEKIFKDHGGEALAVFCKATGLKRSAISELTKTFILIYHNTEYCESLIRQAVISYDMLSTEKAQTVLRYWNWLLTGKTPSGKRRNLQISEQNPHLGEGI